MSIQKSNFKYCQSSKPTVSGLLIFILFFLLFLSSGCRGIYRKVETPTPEVAVKEETSGWKFIPIGISDSGAGAVQIDFAIRNEMQEWSVMKSDAVVKVMTSAGEEKPCGTVKLGSGGHYIPPNLQLRGYTLKDKSVQTLQVLCEGVTAKDAKKLKISYSYVLGEYDYYAQDKNKIEDEQEVPLDAIVTDLKYPFDNASGINAASTNDAIPALNECTLKLVKIERNDEGFTFQWQVENPGEYGTLVHIGNPPVIGDDGIIYGHRVSPDIIQVPVADPKGTAQWETKATLPKEVKNVYMLLSVEKRRERLFANILLDLTQY